MVKMLMYFWLIVATAGIGIGAYMMSTEGVKEGIYFLIITLISGMMYMINKRRYKNYVKNKDTK